MDSESKPNIFEVMFVDFFKVLYEMFKAVLGVLPTVISFVLWVLSAVIILPCVFIAGNIYPSWVKWGEDF